MIKIHKPRHYPLLTASVIAVAILSVIVLAQAVITVHAGNKNATSGAQNVYFPLSLDNNESVAGIQAEVNYNTTYLILKSLEPTSRMQGAAIVFNNQPPAVRIAALANTTIGPGSGAVLNMVFDVNSSAVSGNYTVSLFDVVVSDIEAVSLGAGTQTGVFGIADPYNITFLPPISLEENFTLQNGTTLPFKFNVTSPSGFVHDESVTVTIFNVSLGFSHTYVFGNSSEFVRINDGEHYIVNVHTQNLGMQLGFYTIRSEFGTGQSKEILFELIYQSTGRGKKKN